MSNRLVRRLEAALADHEANAPMDEPCEAEESPSEYDASAKAVTAIGHSHGHTLGLPAPNYITVGGGGSYTVSNPTVGYPSIINNTYNINMDDDLTETLRNLKKSLQDRVLRLKDELIDLSDRYESAEKVLQSSVQQIKDIDTSLSTLEPAVTAPDDYDDIPF